MVFGFWDDDDPRFQAAPQILVDSLEYDIDNDGNAYDSIPYHSNPAPYPNAHLGSANYPPLEGLQRLNLEPPLPEYTIPYDWTTAGTTVRQNVNYNGTLAPSPQHIPRAIPATYQPDFEDYRSSYHGYSAPPTLAQEVTSASSHLPPTPRRTSTVKSSESSKRYSCNRCPQRFKQRKDLDRHTPIHDRVPGGQKIKGRYLCQCGKLDHRKDNHKRHVEKCKKSGGNNFVCQCLFETGHKEEHEDHIRRCREGSNPVGRPARSRATPSVASRED